MLMYTFASRQVPNLLQPAGHQSGVGGGCGSNPAACLHQSNALPKSK